MAQTTIGFIGAGRIGRPMILALLAAGHRVQVYDKFKSAAHSVLAAGATWAFTPKDAATRAEVLITCLARPEHVTECMLDEGGAVHGMAAGTVWVNTSTTDYHSTMKIAEALREKGAYSLEGPVSNLSHMGVDFGNSSIYCAGDKAGYDAVKPILLAMTKVSFFTGAFGTAQTVKLLTNHMFYGSVSICGDCLALSQNAGIPTHWMWEHMRNSIAYSVPVDQFIPMVFDGSYDNSCSLEIGVKDMGLTIALADELGVALPLGRLVNDRYALAGAVYDQRHNHMKVVKLTEDANDLKIRIRDFEAPSKYGINADYVMGDSMATDGYGRVSPTLPARYAAPDFQPEATQQALIETLIAFMAYTNHVLTSEAFDLGRAVGLEKDLISEMIIWSVGTNWVVENRATYVPDRNVLQRMSATCKLMHLPYLLSISTKLDSLQT